MWRARFGRGFGPVVRQTANGMNIIRNKTVNENSDILWDT
jgi:hypothetical protein